MNKTCEIVSIVDCSGSMSPLTQSVIDGFNKFLMEQKKEAGSARLTLIKFDHEYTLIHDSIDLQEVPALDDKVYVTRGWTALYDTVGFAVKNVKDRLEKQGNADRPVIVCIITDGQDNKSSEYTAEQIRTMIQEQEALGWQFIYLSAHPDSFADSTAMGINQTNSMNFLATPKGVGDAYSESTARVSQYRSQQ